VKKPGTARTNVAASAGGTASASSTNSAGSGYPASAVNNGDHKGLNVNSGGVWISATGSFPQWAEVDFNGSKTIDEVDVFTLQDAVTSPAEPTPTMTFTLYGLQGYDVQYWDGSAWVTVTVAALPGTTKSGDN
jgi:hypothetical protein